jgi:hypothetical protein
MPILYKVVVGWVNDLPAFENEVLSFLNDAYIPVGGIAYGTDGKIIQAVAKNTDIPSGPPPSSIRPPRTQ